MTEKIFNTAVLLFFAKDNSLSGNYSFITESNVTHDPIDSLLLNSYFTKQKAMELFATSQVAPTLSESTRGTRAISRTGNYKEKDLDRERERLKKGPFK